MHLFVQACSLLLLTTAAVQGSDNGTEESRGPRVTGRIVKVYSGSRPDPVVCSDEGFQADPANCAVFYRCVKATHGKYTVFRYQCGPGTIYDPETTVCNHPKNTKRSECFGNLDVRSEPKPNEENEIELINSQELPSPIKLNVPAYESQRLQSTSSSASSWMTPAKSSTQVMFTHATTNPPQYVTQKSKQNGDACISDGFMGDSQNCRTFYRCVANGRGGYIRYEFSCSDTTVWDDDLQTCNHPSSVKRSRCGGNYNYNSKHSTIASSSQTMAVTQPATESSGPAVIQEQLQVNYGSKVSQLQIQINNGTNGVVQNQTQVNYGDRANQTQKQENYGSKNKQSQNGSAVSQMQAQINHGNNVIQSQTQIDHTKQASQTQTQSYASDDDDNNQDYEKETQVTQSPQSNGGQKQCTSSGFMSDPDDCKKFYRCVDNGKGGYTKFEFTCGEGTVWDQSIEGCNHVWAVKKCGQSETGTSAPSSTTASSPTTAAQTTQRPQTTPEETTDDIDTGYGNQTPQTTSSSRPSTTTTQVQTTTTEVQTTNSQVSTDGQNKGETECQSNGFMGDPQDCKKFYRCVDNGKGGYTKYEFSCGEGTVWDPEIESCNHAWAVKKCGGSSSTDDKVEMTTKATTTAVHQETSGTEANLASQNDDEDTGYGQPESTSSSSSPTTTMTTTTTEQSHLTESNDCHTSGFMGDKNDCKKFYRCVDDGKGGYTRYEFACGEGTVWDQSIEACNHPWAVKSCGHSDSQPSEAPVDQQTSTSHSTENTEQNPSSSHETTTTKADSGTSASEGTTSSMTPSSSKECKQEGFYGDENDCKKFYRCVDNGNGGYTKYEFTCGEGTVWDQEIQGCNHPTPNQKCGSTQGVSSTSTTDNPNKENDEMSTESTSKPATASSTSQTSPSEKPQSTTTKPSSGTCESEGFYGDPDDCKKFYRCVDDGKGGYTKYDFICGDGTAWDQEIQGCNHETETCKRNSPAGTTETETPQTTFKTPDSTAESEKTTESGKTTTTTEISDSASSNNEGTCTSEGFYANPNDCKKFYRCVSDEKGGFTKYDFACGEGTVWVQEIQACDHDNDVNSCSNQSGSTQPHTTSSSSQPQTSISTTSQPHTSESSTTSTTTISNHQIDADEYPGESPAGSGGQCQSEGFYANENDCTKFYRCVDSGNGGYTKYDFSCGEGTAWDSNIQTCNHISEIESCNGQSQTQPVMHDESSSTSEGTTTKTSGSSTESSKPSDGTTSSGPESSTQSSKPANQDKCTEEGYYGNSQDCTKFYRCVDNGNGGYTKYDFDCGEGTIWDQDITACNHPRDVNNPSCKDGGDSSSSSSSTTSSSSSESKDPNSTESTSESGSSSTESSSQGSSNCTQDNTSKKPANKNVNCTKEGYYADPDDCKKFYRCVDWDGNGEKFSVFHFDCGDGTIWDPSLDTCNHEDSVYPPRDCSGQSQGENMDKETTTTTESTKTTQGESTTTESQTTTEKSTTTEQTTQSTTQSATSEQTTMQESTTSEQTTTQQSTTSEQTTTDQSPTSEQTTTEQSTTSEQTTTQQSTTSEQTTTQQSTTSEQTTTQQSTTSEQTTTQQSTTSEQTTTEQSTTSQETTTQQATEQTTTQESTTSQQTTEQSTTQEATTSQQSTTEQTTTQSNEETTTQQSTTESSTTESNQETTTQQDQSTTTESAESTTQQNNETSSEKQCPETEDDQYLYVCPTSFRRHPKYCNLFYQCTEDDDTHEVKIATFNCPNNTIYDGSKSQCVEESKADKKCDGQIAQRRRVKRLDAEMIQPMVVSSRQKLSCPAVGHFPFDKDDECSPSFLKCNKTKSGKIRGFVYRCPDNYMYWSVSRRCEQKYKLKNCKNSANDWSGRYEIPVERKNIAL